VQQDGNWNVTALVDGTGAVLERMVYDPFGQVSFLTLSWGPRTASAYAFVNLFQGTRRDSATGYYHIRHREYSPTLGRFVQIDPLGFRARDLNLYRVVGNSVTNATDPSGLIIGKVVGGWWSMAKWGYGTYWSYAKSMGSFYTGVGAGVFDGWWSMAKWGYGTYWSYAKFMASFYPSLPGWYWSATTWWYSNVLGKIWAAPVTVGAWPLVGWGWIFGGKVSFGHNAIQVENHPFMLPGCGLTLGNIILYGSGAGPATIGPHEEQHTYQAQILGPYYLPAHLVHGLRSVILSGINSGVHGLFGGTSPSRGISWHYHNVLEWGPEGDDPTLWAPPSPQPHPWPTWGQFWARVNSFFS
jgi:RHS repeat-associated protein